MKTQTIGNLALRLLLLNLKRIIAISIVLFLLIFLTSKSFSKGEGVFLLASLLPLFLCFFFFLALSFASIRGFFIGKELAFEAHFQHTFELKEFNESQICANIRLELSKYLVGEVQKEDGVFWLAYTPMTFYSFGEVISVKIASSNQGIVKLEISSVSIFSSMLSSNKGNVENIQNVLSAASMKS